MVSRKAAQAEEVAGVAEAEWRSGGLTGRCGYLPIVNLHIYQ
jgi:hypothetical protein